MGVDVRESIFSLCIPWGTLTVASVLGVAGCAKGACCGCALTAVKPPELTGVKPDDITGRGISAGGLDADSP